MIVHDRKVNCSWNFVYLIINATDFRYVLSLETTLRCLFANALHSAHSTLHPIPFSWIFNSQPDFTLFSHPFTVQLSTAQISEAMEVFQSTDLDGDKFITLEEYKTCLREMGMFEGDTKAKEVFAYADSDGDAKVDATEFLDMVRFLTFTRRQSGDVNNGSGTSDGGSDMSDGRGIGNRRELSQFRRFYSRKKKITSLRLEPGSKLDVKVPFPGGKWRSAVITSVDRPKKLLRVHFEGWEDKYDEWIQLPNRRIRPHLMKTLVSI